MHASRLLAILVSVAAANIAPSIASAQAMTGADRAKADRQQVENSRTMDDRAKSDPKVAAEVERVRKYDKPVYKDPIINSVGANPATSAGVAAAKAAKQAYDDKKREEAAKRTREVRESRSPDRRTGFQN